MRLPPALRVGTLSVVFVTTAALHHAICTSLYKPVVELQGNKPLLQGVGPLVCSS